MPQDDLQQLGEYRPHLRGSDEVLLRVTDAVEQITTPLHRLFGLFADVNVHLRADHPLRFVIVSAGDDAAHILNPFPRAIFAAQAVLTNIVRCLAAKALVHRIHYRGEIVWMYA